MQTQHPWCPAACIVSLLVRPDHTTSLEAALGQCIHAIQRDVDLDGRVALIPGVVRDGRVRDVLCTDGSKLGLTEPV